VKVAAIEAPKASVPKRVAAPKIVSESTSATIAKAREGKTMLGGYYSQEMGRAIRVLSAETGLSVQALIGEGLDAMLRKHGKHPFGER
jgi:hypothetical protein